MLRSRLIGGSRNNGWLKMDGDAPFVEFRIPPDSAYLRVARLVTADMGGRAGFSVDELDDVRLAVDEVCAMLIHAGGDALELRMQARERVLIIDGFMPGTRSLVAPSELSEVLLAVLVDSCAFTAHDDGVSFEMCKWARELA